MGSPYLQNVHHPYTSQTHTGKLTTVSPKIFAVRNISSYAKINVKKFFCVNIIYIYLQLTDKRPSELLGKSNSADSAGFIMMTSLPASPWQPTMSTLINPAVVYSPEVELQPPTCHVIITLLA